MRFVFFDKTETEMELIVEVLKSENIYYKIERKITHSCFFDIEEEEDFIISEEFYNIICFTDLNHFDFVKKIAEEKIENMYHLEKCYIKSFKRKKKQRAIKNSP